MGCVFLAGLWDAHPGVARFALDDLVGQYLTSFGHFCIIVAPAHQPLDRKDGIVRVDHSLAPGRLTYQPFIVLAKRDHRGAEPPAFRRRDYGRFAAFHDSYSTVRRSQINTNYLSHRFPSLQKIALVVARSLLRGERPGKDLDS